MMFDTGSTLLYPDPRALYAHGSREAEAGGNVICRDVHDSQAVRHKYLPVEAWPDASL